MNFNETRRRRPVAFAKVEPANPAFGAVVTDAAEAIDWIAFVAVYFHGGYRTFG